MDAYSRRILGWSIAHHMRTELVLDALGMAILRRRASKGDEIVETWSCGAGCHRQFPGQQKIIVTWIEGLDSAER